MNPLIATVSSGEIRSPLIVALDCTELSQALTLVAELDPQECRVKVGKELFTRCGPRVVEALAERGYQVFLDLKFHDIPNTVAQACRAAAESGAWMINVHTLGGRRMLEAARAALALYQTRPLLTGVTILTSLEVQDLVELGMNDTPDLWVMRLAHLARECGLDGVVCSAHEARALKSALGKAFVLVTPGIRLAEADKDDQRRVMTPKAARDAGADYLVIGRPVTQAKVPREVVRQINQQISMS